MTISLADTKMTTPHTVSEAALARYAETSSSDSVSGGFSGNFVLEFARMRLKHIDGWLESRLTTLKNNARATEELNELVAVLSKYSSGFGSMEKDDKAAQGAIQAAFNKAIGELAAGSPIAARLMELCSTKSVLYDGGARGTDAYVTADQMSEIIKKVENELKKLDTASQEGQLLVNQKMGERSEVMQLAAMLIQQINDTAKGILQRS